jgi:hypothetical protein
MTSSRAALAIAGVATALSAAGCYSDITASSRTYLGPTGSGAVVGHPLADTATEVTRLFATRGYSVIDQLDDTASGERRLKLATPERVLDKNETSIVDARYVGSVFYVWIAPDAAGTGATVRLLGKPTLAGVEPCTQDGVALVCSDVSVPRAFAERYLRAHAEVDVTRAVLAELTREGYAVHALPADAAPPTPDSHKAIHGAQIAECRAARARAASVLAFDPAGGTAVLQSPTRCDEPWRSDSAAERLDE